MWEEDDGVNDPRPLTVAKRETQRHREIERGSLAEGGGGFKQCGGEGISEISMKERKSCEDLEE